MGGDISYHSGLKFLTMISFFIFIYFGCTRSSLQHMGSVVVVLQCSCPEVCGILVPQPGIEPESSALEGGFLTIGLPGKSPFLKSDPEVGLSRRSLWGIPWMVVTMLSNTRSKKVKRTHIVSMPCLEPHGLVGGDSLCLLGDSASPLSQRPL